MTKKFTPIQGSLEKLTEPERADYVSRACDYLGIPNDLNLIDLIWLDSGDGAKTLTLYLKRGGTDLIRNKRGINVVSLAPANGDGYVAFVATGKDSNGRQEMSVGSAATKGLSGQAIATAVMLSQTRALRRMTLQFVGGGFLDESEVHETTTNIATSASSLQQIAQQPTVAPSTVAGKDITESAEEPKADRKPRKKRTVTLDYDGQTVPAPEPSQSEKLEAELEPRPEHRETVEIPNTSTPESIAYAKAASEAHMKDLPAPKPVHITEGVLEPAQASKEEKPFVGTRPTKEQSDAFRAKLSTLVNDTLPRGGFRQSQGLGSKYRKIDMFAQCMFPKADPKVLSYEQQSYFLDWIDKKIVAIGLEETVALINKTIGETE